MIGPVLLAVKCCRILLDRWGHPLRLLAIPADLQWLVYCPADRRAELRDVRDLALPVAIVLLLASAVLCEEVVADMGSTCAGFLAVLHVLEWNLVSVGTLIRLLEPA